MKKMGRGNFFFSLFNCLIFVGTITCSDKSEQPEQPQFSGQALCNDRLADSKFLGVAKGAIKLDELHLYKLLLQTKTNINSVLSEFLKQGDHEGFFKKLGAFFSMCNPTNILTDENKASYTKKLSAALHLFEEALKIMREIAQDFNNEALAYNPEIEILFINMCNFLREEEMVHPWNLRCQLQGVKRFNQYLTNYCISHKDSLKVEDLKLFDRITKFNQILMLCILQDEYFDVGVYDKFLDMCFYRPMEFIVRHKVFVASVPITVAGCFVACWYFEVQDFFDHKQRESE